MRAGARETNPASVPWAESLLSMRGRVALVTGGTGGLGLEIARALGRAGAHVLVNGRDPGRVDRAVEALRASGSQASAIPFDLTDAAAREASVARALEHCGRIDALINNAGQRLRAPIGTIEPADFERLLSVNLGAVYGLSRQVATAMCAQGRGRIVMLSSIAATLGRAGDVAYISAKGGLSALTRALACEYGPHGVTCNAIAPGAFLTDANRAAYRPGDAFTQRTPLGRWGEPHEIVGPALFLASDAASYVNGHVLTVDGGYSIAF